LPNLPDPSAPDGSTEEDAVVVKMVGEPPQLGFGPRDHLEMGTALGLIDMERAARASGSRFAYLKGDLVLLELALLQYAMSKLAGYGFEPVIPPVLVREEPMFWTGFLPTDRAQIYEIAGDDLYLVGTSEVSLAALHAEEILAVDDLPLRYAGFSTCFRREAGAAGRDTRGIFRVHQFDKVEMYSFVEPGSSAEEHERLLAIEEEVLTELDIPYRVVNVAAGDLGASAAKKYDCEAWLPGQGRYRELTSTSNTTDYQARRMRCRFRPAGGGSPRMVHTLNGTAVAVGRTLLAIVENHQRADGGFTVPAVLHRFGAPTEVPGSS
jgi:seryl-tRNA synthetase